MKKVILAVLIALVSLGSPVLAGGSYRSAPHNHGDGLGHELGHGLEFLVKLPFRLVTSTLVGVTGIIADQDLNGFEEGYEMI